MDILSIAKIVAPLAPVAGTIIGGLVGGPPGAAIGGKLASFVLGQFGLPATATPAQLSDAVATAGEETARAKINAAMEQARAQIAGFTEIETAALEAVTKTVLGTQETIRAETAGRVQLALQGMKEHWFFTAGRPASLWVFNVVSLCFGLMLTTATAKAAWNAADPLKVLTEAWPLFASYFGPLCLVNGVYINARSKEKTAAIENAAPMPNAVTAPATKPAAPKPSTGLIGKPAGSRD